MEGALTCLLGVARYSVIALFEVIHDHILITFHHIKAKDMVCYSMYTITPTQRMMQRVACLAQVGVLIQFNDPSSVYRKSCDHPNGANYALVAYSHELNRLQHTSQ